jgi:hypothetical protein
MADTQTRLQHHFLPDGRLAEPVLDLHHHHRRQRLLNAHLLLHNREIRSSPTTHLGRCRHDSLRVCHRHRRYRLGRLESGKLCLDRLRVSVHLLLRLVSLELHSAYSMPSANSTTAPGAQQGGSLSARSSSFPSVPRAWPSRPRQIGSGTALLVRRIQKQHLSTSD